jgi:hypothetical protein
METSQNMNKGTHSGRITRLEPQSDWDSFSLRTGFPKGEREIFPSPTGMTKSHLSGLGMEETTQEGRTVETLSPQQWIPQRRGRPRKNKEVVETKLSDESRAQSIVEKLLMRIVRLEPLDASGSNYQETTQQLKQAKLSIIELYHENRKLRQQGREGNATWLKRQLREAQDTIVQLREAQQLSEERNAKHSRECEVVEEIARMALANEKKNQD